ncbi:MAG: SRPBCC domain-containing protein [Bacteroidia bacterium]
MKRNEPPIIVEQGFGQAAAELWEAITDHSRMTRWYFEHIPAFEPVPGFETSFEVKSGDRIFTHCWKVTEVVPGQRISYTWRYEEYPGDAIVSFEIFETDTGSLLRLTLRVLEDFQETIPEFTRDSCLAGWNYFLGERLKEFLE